MLNHSARCWPRSCSARVVTPWSTNATEIAANVGLTGIARIERFRAAPPAEVPVYDPMLEAVYQGISAQSLVVDLEPEPLRSIVDISAYNAEAGLALSADEVALLYASGTGGVAGPVGGDVTKAGDGTLTLLASLVFLLFVPEPEGELES